MGSLMSMASPQTTTFQRTPTCRKGWSYSNYDRACVQDIWISTDQPCSDDAEWTKCTGDNEVCTAGRCMKRVPPDTAKEGGEIKNGKIYTRKSRVRR